MKLKTINHKQMAVTGYFDSKHLAEAIIFQNFVKSNEIEMEVCSEYIGEYEYIFFAYEPHDNNKLELLLQYFFQNKNIEVLH